MMHKTRILVADDHQLFLTGLVALLTEHSEFDVVGHASDGREALRKARQLKPDVIILDISMPNLNGIEACRQLTRELDTKVLCLSMYTENRYVAAALESGAAGYLVKDCELDELLRAIRSVAAGQTFLSPTIAGTLVDVLRGHRPNPRASTPLTDREREVLQLLAEGRSTQDIADELCISSKTVHTHRKHLQEKLRIHSIADLTKYAVREGLTSSQPTYTSD